MQRVLFLLFAQYILGSILTEDCTAVEIPTSLATAIVEATDVIDATFLIVARGGEGVVRAMSLDDSIVTAQVNSVLSGTKTTHEKRFSFNVGLHAIPEFVPLRPQVRAFLYVRRDPDLESATVLFALPYCKMAAKKYDSDRKSRTQLSRKIIVTQLRSYPAAAMARTLMLEGAMLFKPRDLALIRDFGRSQNEWVRRSAVNAQLCIEPTADLVIVMKKDFHESLGGQLQFQRVNDEALLGRDVLRGKAILDSYPINKVFGMEHPITDEVDGKGFGN
ncbi:MAG: hypothetical protein JNK76_22455 [Planctomycetales bacterium]|nr:hypothetical protein [Planctomycetales bacterium]MBN8628626.1 hypothetical protein [Planctomycetota bacterium]